MLEDKSLPKNWEDTETKANKKDIVDNVTTADSAKMLSANQGVILWSAIQAIADGGTFEALAKLAERYGKIIHTGTLNANELSIAVGKQLYNFELFIDGDRIDESHFIANKKLGTINLTEAYADYETTWVIVDEMDYRIKFSYPTMQLLQGTTDAFKATIEIDDTIEIQGGSVANDGDHRLVVCKSTQGLNGVQIGTNKWLNEVPNTRVKTIADNVSVMDSNKLGKTEKAVDSDKLDGQDSTYFAKQSDMTSANTQINQNKSDILLKLDKSEVFETGATTSKTYVVKNEEGTTKLGKWLDFMDNPTDTKYQARLYTENGALFLAQNNDLGGLVFHEGNCPISKQPIGYCKLANGLIIQWGFSVVNFPLYDTYGVLTVNFPISFSDTGFSLITKGIVNALDFGGEPYLETQTIVNQNNSGSVSAFKVGMRCVDSNFVTGRALKWIAVGY